MDRGIVLKVLEKEEMEKAVKETIEKTKEIDEGMMYQ